MRKMTKTAVTLAAMSAMTVASASMAFAAKQEENLTALPTATEVKEAGAGAGTWAKKADDNWTFTKEDGTKLKDTWAEIDGIWYYFEGENMVRNDFIEIDGKDYYFDQNGTLATGWQKITSNTDAYDAITISEQLLYSTANTYVGESYAYDYMDYVWCYFNEDGTAKENEWFQNADGLWFYFDNNVMVMNMMNYIIDPDNHDMADSSSYEMYGFDENGYMLTGWNKIKRKDTGWNDPTSSTGGYTYYYYNPDGSMQKVGWAKIDGKWYLFADYDGLKYGVGNESGTDQQIAKSSGFALITNSYITSAKSDSKNEYFYLSGTKGKEGEMQTGVTKVPKDAWKITFYPKTVDGDIKVAVDYENMYNTSSKVIVDTEANFGSNGAAKEAVVNKRYYLDVDSSETVVVDWDYVIKESNSLVSVIGDETAYNDITTAVTGSGAAYVVNGDMYGSNLTSDKDINDNKIDRDIKAQLVKSAFIGTDKNELYLADKDGDFVTNKAVLVDKDANIAKFDNAGNIVYEKDDQGNYVLDANGDKIQDFYQNAYILLGSDGKAYTGYEGKRRSFTVGGVTYWASDYTIEIGDAEVTVFVSNKQVNKQD